MYFAYMYQALPTDLNTISIADCEALMREVTKERFYKTLIPLPEGEGLGLDGMNVEFYNFSRMVWGTIFT